MMPKRVIVADDDESIRRLILFVLTKKGYATREATNGAAAVELARQEPPDLIMLDVMMPGMSGFDAARLLRADEATATVPILFCSAGGEAVLANEADLEGDHYFTLVKPFTPKELRERVEQILGDAATA